MQIQDMYSEIVLQLEKLCETEASISRLEWFKLQHKEPGLKSYGVKTPAVRKLIKARAQRLHERVGLESPLGFERENVFRVQ